MEEFWSIVFIIVVVLFGIGYAVHMAWPFLSVVIPICIFGFFGYVFYDFKKVQSREAENKHFLEESRKQKEIDQIKNKIKKLKSNV